MKRRAFLTRASLLSIPVIGAQATASGDTGSVSTGSREAQNVRRFGAVGDGDTDDSAAIQAAVDTSAAVYFPEGNYLVRKAINLRSGSSLIGDGTATLRTDGTNYILSAIGRIGARNPIKVSVKRLDTAIAVDSNSVNTFRGGGGYFLQSDRPPLGHPIHLSGEIGNVASVTSSSVIVSGAILADYHTSDNAMAAPVTFVEDVSIRGLRLSNDNYTVSPGKVTSALIYLEFVSRCHVSDCNLQENNSAGIAIFNCLNGQISNNQIGKLRDGRRGILGYGVQIGFSSQNIAITSNCFYECRHAVTTGTGRKSSRTPNHGVSRGITIVGNSVSNCTNAALDTHEDSDGVTITGNAISGCRSVGIHVRSYESTVCGNTISPSFGTGIKISKTARGTVVSGNVIKGIRRTPSGGDGILLDCTSVTVCGNQISECDRYGIYVHENATRDISITGNSFRNNGQSETGAGVCLDTKGMVSGFTLVGNSCIDSPIRQSPQPTLKITPGSRISGSDSVVASNNFSNNVLTLSGSGISHCVSGASLIRLAVRGTVTEFEGGFTGQSIKVIAENPVTISHSSKLRLKRSQDLKMMRGDNLELTMFEDSVWQETGRSIG